MNPITSILSPDKNHVILYFVNTEKQQLAMSEFPVISSAKSLSYTDHETPQGEVALEQCIQAVTLRGMPTVFGWIDREQKKVLAKLSPVTNFLDNKTKQKSMTTSVPSFAAATDGVSKTYLYFLKKLETADPQLYETIQTYDTTNTSPVTNDSIKSSAKSRLAVSYDPESGELNTRTVFFQQKTNNDNKIYWVDLTDSQDPNSVSFINGTESAMDGTPLSVTRGDDATLWLYWMNANNMLQRATKPKGGSWTLTTPGIKNIPKQKLLTSSQISVTQATAGNAKQNHVFYIEAGGEEILDHVDTGL